MEEDFNHKRASYYSILPATVRYDRELPDKAKLIYSEITALSNIKGYCWTTNKYLATLYGTTQETVSRYISKLKEKGYISIKTIYKGDSKEILERQIYINDTPLDKNINTPLDENINTPLDENIKENNIKDLIIQDFMIDRLFTLYFKKIYEKMTISDKKFFIECLGKSDLIIRPQHYDIMSKEQKDFIHLCQDTLITINQSKVYQPLLRNVNYKMLVDIHFRFKEYKEKGKIKNDINYLKNLLLKELQKQIPA